MEGIGKSFGGIVAVRDFSLTVSDGEVAGLIGPNGAGKTTVFNLISGIVDVDRGRIIFGGADITSLKPHRRVALGLSRTFQLVRPFARMTVAENVLAGVVFGSRGRKGKRDDEAVLDLLEQVSLLEKAERPAGVLTIAELRRLDLARALATMPRLLMLDEVMAGLSPEERKGMVELLGRVAKGRGMAMVVSEHVMDAVVGLCGRLVVMDHGMNLVEGETESVLRSEKVAEVYLGKPAQRLRPAYGVASPAEAGG